jgi:hypothetical protein
VTILLQRIVDPRTVASTVDNNAGFRLGLETLFESEFPTALYCLLICDAVHSGRSLLAFWRNTLLPFSGSESKFACRLLLVGYLLGFSFYPKNVGFVFLRNVGHLPDSTGLHARR